MDLNKYLPSPEMQADFARFRNLPEEEQEAFLEERDKRFEALREEEKTKVREETKEGLLAIKENLQEIKLRLELDDVANAISLSYIAKTYFGKSKAWLYQRLNGNMVNGKRAQFTDEERKRFAKALHDLSRRIEETALRFT